MTTISIAQDGVGTNCEFIIRFYIYKCFKLVLATFNPKNKGRRLHRHLEFFGTLESGGMFVGLSRL
jgi:hypothetical protein